MKQPLLVAEEEALLGGNTQRSKSVQWVPFFGGVLTAMVLVLMVSFFAPYIGEVTMEGPYSPEYGRELMRVDQEDALKAPEDRELTAAPRPTSTGYSNRGRVFMNIKTSPPSGVAYLSTSEFTTTAQACQFKCQTYRPVRGNTCRAWSWTNKGSDKKHSYTYSGGVRRTTVSGRCRMLGRHTIVQQEQPAGEHFVSGVIGLTSQFQITSLAAPTMAPTPAPTPAPPAYVVVQYNHECDSRDNSMGRQSSALACRNAVKARGGKYFIFGKGRKRGKCYWERTSSASCPEGWDRDHYDFYRIP